MTRAVRYRFRFGTAEYDEVKRSLQVDGDEVSLIGRSLDVLECLLHHAGEIVTREELRHEVWPTHHIEDNAIDMAVSRLRSALGQNRQFVRTQRGLGYTLAGDIERTALDAIAPRLPALKVNGTVPGRSDLRLQQRLSGTDFNETWLATGPAPGERSVIKFSASDEGLRALKRESALSNLIHETLSDPDRYTRVIEHHFAESPFWIRCEYAGMDLLAWSQRPEGGLRTWTREQRLDLFAKIVDAVADAHRIGLLHKDLKPGNILVHEDETGFRVRLGDFGASGLLQLQMLVDRNLTMHGLSAADLGVGLHAIGTPQYAAPELMEGVFPSPMSDIYALGVILYQLIVGDLKRVLHADWRRDIDDALLVDDIARCTARDPKARFASASELLAQLENLPERALEVERKREADQRWVALSAQAARDRDAVLRDRSRRKFYAVAAVLLIAGMAMTWTQYRQAEKARIEVQAQAERTARVNAFWNDNLIQSGNPLVRGEGRQATLLDALGYAFERVPVEFADDPRTAAEIDVALGEAFAGTGTYTSALAAFDRAYRLMVSVGEAKSATALLARFRYGYFLTGVGRFDEAESVIDGELVNRDASGLPDEIALHAWRTIAVVYQQQGDVERAIPSFEQALAAMRHANAPTSLIAGTLVQLAENESRAGRYADARRNLETVQAMAADGGDVGLLVLAYARFMNARTLQLEYRDLERAEQLFVGAYEDVKRFAGEDAYSTVVIEASLASFYGDTKRFDRQLEVARHAYEMALRGLGAEAFTTVRLLGVFAAAQIDAGDIEAGLGNLRSAYDQMMSQVGSTSPQIQPIEFHLATGLALQGRYDEARFVLDRVSIETLRETLIEADVRTRYEALRIAINSMSGPFRTKQLRSIESSLGRCACNPEIEAMLVRKALQRSGA